MIDLDLLETRILTRDIRASELVLSLPPSKRSATNDPVSQGTIRFSTSTPARAKSLGPMTSFPGGPSPMPAQAMMRELGTGTSHPAFAPYSYDQVADMKAQEYELEIQDADILSAARVYIDAREFSRAIHLLKDGRSAKAQFIRVYSKFMVSLPHSGVNANGLRSCPWKSSEKQAMRDWHKLDSRS